MSDFTVDTELILYKLDNCTFLLADSKAAKTLDYFGSNAYTANCGENASILDNSSKQSSRVSKETINVTDKKNGFSYGKKRTEVLSILDTYNKKHIKPINEQLILSDMNIKYTSINKREKFTVEDKLFKQLVHKILENIGISETYWDNVNFIINIAENIILSEIGKKQLGRKFFEVVKVIDIPKNNISFIKKENIIASDLIIKGPSRTLKEGFQISDYSNKQLASVLKEHITFRELLAKNSNVILNETVEVLDDFSRFLILYRDFQESLSIQDKKYLTEAKRVNEEISVNDNYYKQIVENYLETLGVTDTFTRRADFTRRLAENIHVIDLLRNRYWLETEEVIGLYDSFIQTCLGVLSNLVIKTDNNFTLEDFEKAMITAPGYDEFIEFNVGDYEYKEALVRLLIERKEMTSEPVIYDVAVHVDIDDTDDRGNLTITDTTAPTNVYYNKHYYNPPEVQATLKGGAEQMLYPVILSTNKSDVDGRYFEIEIRNSSGNRATGTIAWVAKGY